MMILPFFYQRNFEILPVQPELDWQVESCVWALPGGPDTAVLKARGASWQQREWTGLLRCPVELLDEQGRALWWGYVAGVEQDGVCFSLDGLYNRVRVDYRFVSGSDPLHVYADDLISQQQYGVKELLFDLGVIDHTARAQAVAQSWLERTSRPAVTWRTQGAGELRLRLRGWWHTLGWRFHLWDGEGRRAYAPEPVEEANIGSAATVVRAAQGFPGPAGAPEWTVSRVRVKLRKVGSPADFLRIGIQTDSGGNPSGVELDGLDIPAASLTTSLAWYEFELPGLSAALQTGQNYHLVFSRTGANNSSNYYRVGLDTPYPVIGALYYRYWNGSTWIQRSPNSIAVHMLWGITSAGQMIAHLAGEQTGGQFLTGLDVPADGGRWTAVPREEARTCRREITDLLGLGSADGPWTALVTSRRGLRVLAFPPGSETGAQVAPDGTLYGIEGELLPARHVPLGTWARRMSAPAAPPVLVERARLVDGRVRIE